MVYGVHYGVMSETKMQDVRIRRVPEPLVRKLKVILMERDMTLAEWFLGAAGLTVDGKKGVGK